MEKRQLDIEGFKAYLKEKFPVPFHCPLCGAFEWNVDPNFFELRQFFDGSLHVGAPVAPLITMTCQNCGQVTFFNALTSKQLKDKEEKAPVKDEGPKSGTTGS